jgi:hypothetical protein
MSARALDVTDVLRGATLSTLVRASVSTVRLPQQVCEQRARSLSRSPCSTRSQSVALRFGVDESVTLGSGTAALADHAAVRLQVCHCVLHSAYAASICC